MGGIKEFSELRGARAHVSGAGSRRVLLRLLDRSRRCRRRCVRPVTPDRAPGPRGAGSAARGCAVAGGRTGAAAPRAVPAHGRQARTWDAGTRGAVKERAWDARGPPRTLYPSAQAPSRVRDVDVSSGSTATQRMFVAPLYLSTNQ